MLNSYGIDSCLIIVTLAYSWSVNFSSRTLFTRFLLFPARSGASLLFFEMQYRRNIVHPKQIIQMIGHSVNKGYIFLFFYILAMSFDSMLAYGKASINGKLVWVAEGGHDLCLLHLPCKHQCPFKEGGNLHMFAE